MFWTTGKGDRQWETRAVRKIRRRVRNRTPKNRNKNQKTRLISSQKESLDRNHGAEICTTYRSFNILGTALDISDEQHYLMSDENAAMRVLSLFYWLLTIKRILWSSW
jgi:hypothetical protein